VRRDVEADLVVALAGAAVGDRVGALLLGDLDQKLGEQRPGEGGGERVGALVHRAGLERAPDVLRDERLAPVDHVGLRRPRGHGAPLDALA
jgi:hypothetical protein